MGFCSWLNNKIDQCINLVEDVVEATVDIAGDVFEATGEIFEEVVDLTIDAIDVTLDFAEEVAEATGEIFEEVVDLTIGAVDATLDFAEEVAEATGEIFEEVVDLTIDAVDATLDFAEEVAEATGEIFEEVVDLTIDAVDATLDFAEEVAETTGEIFEEVVDLTIDAVELSVDLMDDIRAETTNMWGNATGKNQALEAEEIYNELNEAYTKHKKQFDVDMNRNLESITESVRKITGYKDLIVNEYLVKIEEKISRFREVRISKEYNLDEFKKELRNIEILRTKSELFTVDVDCDFLMENIFSVLFFEKTARAKAIETLASVKAEKIRVKVEMKEMDREVSQFNTIKVSYENVVNVFEKIVELYKQLIIRLNDAINCVIFKSSQENDSLLTRGLSLTNLPRVMRNEVQALWGTSAILMKLIKTSFTMNQDNHTECVENIKVYENEILTKVA